jgi:hypothetical protein
MRRPNTKLEFPKKRLKGDTLAHRRFDHTMMLTRRLLAAGLFGLEAEVVRYKGVVAKVEGMPIPKGPTPKHTAEVLEVERLPNGDFQLKMDVGTARVFRQVVRHGYLIRNIVAHNTGLVRQSLRKSLPRTVAMAGDELRITKAFLENMIKVLERTEQQIERKVVLKFFKGRAVSHQAASPKQV